jgi:hypothetical protein
MRFVRLSACIGVVLGVLLLAGCGHKLVAAHGEHTVAVYPDKTAFDRVQSMKKMGGPVGMLGGLGENLVSRKVNDQTPVRVISTDPEGAQVEVLGGPDKGLKGFVAKENLD